MYDWKWGHELGWAALNAALVSMLQVLVNFYPEQITDWRVWVISLGAGGARAAAVAVLAVLGKARSVA